MTGEKLRTPLDILCGAFSVTVIVIPEVNSIQGLFQDWLVEDGILLFIMGVTGIEKAWKPASIDPDLTL